MSGAGSRPDVLEAPPDMMYADPEMSPGCCMSGEVRWCKDLLRVYG